MMKLLRWSNPRTQAPGARHQTSVFHGERGWKSRKISAPPAEGEKCSLTFPFIEQALSQLIVGDPDDEGPWRLLAKSQRPVLYGAGRVEILTDPMRQAI